MQPKRTDPYYQAQAILARRGHAEQELRQKLKRKGFSSSQINEVVEKMKKENLINDQQYVESFINSTLSYKAVGRFWLQQKLYNRGVPTALIDQGLEKVEEETWRQAALTASRSWQRRHANQSLDRNKLMRFLAGRGFSRELSEAAIQDSVNPDEDA